VPLVAQSWQQRRVASLEGVDRAALDTLGVAVVLPVQREALIARSNGTSGPRSATRSIWRRACSS
jgi:hypothetical protein